jgi:signal transduction histidine kinase
MQQFQPGDPTIEPAASPPALEKGRGEPTAKRAEAFLRLAHHELLGPLTAVRVQARLAATYLERQNMSAVAGALATIAEQSVHMEQLLKDLLDAATLQEGRLSIHPSILDIVGLCRQMVVVQAQVTGRPIAALLPAEPVLVRADGQRLRQVLDNLLTNACKYSPADRPIEVELVPTSTRDDARQLHFWATICVRDRGAGIPAEELPRIFRLFYRSRLAMAAGGPGNAEAGGEGSGLGLGLALCAEIVAVSGGDLWVESTPGGGGSTFFVRLPVLHLPSEIEIN